MRILGQVALMPAPTAFITLVLVPINHRGSCPAAGDAGGHNSHVGAGRIDLAHRRVETLNRRGLMSRDSLQNALEDVEQDDIAKFFKPARARVPPILPAPTSAILLRTMMLPPSEQTPKGGFERAPGGRLGGVTNAQDGAPGARGETATIDRAQPGTAGEALYAAASAPPRARLRDSRGLHLHQPRRRRSNSKAQSGWRSGRLAPPPLTTTLTLRS